jgi:O-antigen/teichoic acid export membrane protein
MIKRLFYTSAVYLIGSVFAKVLSTVAFLLLARLLLPEKMGQVSFFVTLVDVITVFSTFGLNQWYVKHVKPDEEKKFFQQVFKTRAVWLCISLIGTILFLQISRPFSFVVSMALYLALISEAFLSIIDGYYLEKKQVWRVTSKVTTKMIVLAAGVAIFWLMGKSPSAEFAICLYVLGSLISALWLFPRHLIDRESLTKKIDAAQISLQAAPYALLIGTSFFYARGDWFVIQATLGSAALGLYSAAYRYLEGMSLIPVALTQNLFPVSAKKEGITSLQLQQITGAMTIFGGAAAILLFAGASFLTSFLLGPQYKGAELLVKIFAGVVFFFFINAPLSTVVQSSSLVKKFLPFGILNTFLNIALNIWLVPHYHLTAAAGNMLLTEVTGFLINCWFVYQVYEHHKTAKVTS